MADSATTEIDSLEPQARELYDNARAGDAQARNDLATLLLSVVPNVAASVARRQYKHLADELESEANLEIVLIADRLIKQETQPTCIIAGVVRSLLRHLRYHAIICSSPVPQGLRTTQQRVSANERLEKSRELGDKQLSLTNRAKRRARLLKSAIEDCCTTPDEERVIALRSQGYKAAESARQLGLSRDTVSRCRTAVRQRFDKYMADLPPLKTLGA